MQSKYHKPMIKIKNTSFKQLFYIICLCSFATCQYPLTSYEQAHKERFLFINADLTETYGKVRVEYSIDAIKLDNTYTPPPEIKANIYVEDSKGVRVAFQNKIENTNFHGVVGETYKLYVEAEGRKYESTAEKMPKCPEIDSVVANFMEDAALPENNALHYSYNIDVFTKDFKNEVNYYQWEWTHYIRIIYCGSGFFVDREVGYPCKTDCFGIEPSRKINVFADKFVDGQNMQVTVSRIPFRKPPNRYYLNVEQRSITKTTHDYFKSIQQQTESNGTPFDVPAQTLFSPNIKSITDPNEKVLGLFNVFSFRKKISITDLTKEVQGKFAPGLLALPEHPFPYPSPPCIEGEFRTRTKPEGWTD
jgi:Domain of unknown function (DUF4249)